MCQHSQQAVMYVRWTSQTLPLPLRLLFVMNSIRDPFSYLKVQRRWGQRCCCSFIHWRCAGNHIILHQHHPLSPEIIRGWSICQAGLTGAWNRFLRGSIFAFVYSYWFLVRNQMYSSWNLHLIDHFKESTRTWLTHISFKNTYLYCEE